MLNLHTFYRKFGEVGKEDKFARIDIPVEPTSLFVIFQQLQQVRAQKKYFEDKERHLLKIADIGFQQLEQKKNG